MSSIIFHYSGNSSIQKTLSEITNDLATHKDIHDWDEDIYPDLVKRLATFSRNELSRRQLAKADYLVNFSVVQETKTVNDVIVRQVPPKHTSSAVHQLFPVSLNVVSNTKSLDSTVGVPSSSQGRVVETKEHINDFQRSSLLLLQLFCLRLANEEFTFIRAFIQRHVLLETAYKEPSLFQALSPSDSLQRCYKRITLSFHLSHLLLCAHSSLSAASGVIDRSLVGRFEPKSEASSEENQQYLFKASSSVLLTITIPQVQPNREEEHRLLSDPEGLWSVIIVNGSWRMASTSNLEPLEFQTPIAQFVRGICSTVISQRVNIHPIVHELKEKLRASDDDSLFDDQQFSKSRMYHWIIKTCHETRASIQANLKFLQDFTTNRLPVLRGKAHVCEQHGIEHWSLRLREEIAELDNIQMEVDSLREQVRELRDALHGATALLESRIAVMQGDRIKTLTYVTIAYLPISTVSSIYSMKALPDEANLVSYFIVIIVVLLVTLLAAIAIQKYSAHGAERHFKHSEKDDKRSTAVEDLYRAADKLWELTCWTALQIRQFFLETLKSSQNTTDNKFLIPMIFVVYLVAKTIWLLISTIFKVLSFLLWEYPKQEVVYGLNLLYKPPVSVIMPRIFSFRKLVLDLLRFILLPIWLVLVAFRQLMVLTGWLLYECWLRARQL